MAEAIRKRNEIEAKYKKETLSLEDVKARMARVMDAVGDLDA